MFGVLGQLADAAADTVDRTVRDPLGTTVRAVTSPIRHGIDVLDGLTVGEIRATAALYLGADIAMGMATSEILEALADSGQLEDFLADVGRASSESLL